MEYAKIARGIKMAIYECTVCKYVYDESKNTVPWNELDDGWLCPVCDSAKKYFILLHEENSKRSSNNEEIFSDFEKSHDDFELYLSDIHNMAKTGKSLSDPMRTKKSVISWDDLLIKGSQLAKLPLGNNDFVNTKTIIGKNAKHPLVIEMPVFISHMSFGALSKEAKIALARGSSLAKTAICSGEGGIIPEEINEAYKYIFEYVPNKYSVTPENLKRADAIEIKIGQGTKPGMGGHLPKDKVTAEIAKIRGKTIGEDIHSPSFFEDIKTKQELKDKIDWLRKMSDGKPIGVKIAAGNIEEDLDFILFANPDFITIDGRGGGTGSAPKFVKDSTSIPTLFALYRARRFLDKKNSDVSLIITGGFRIPSDFAKALCLGADAIAIATAAMIAAGCSQYRVCNTGKCPLGIATQDPELRKRLKIDISAKRVENFFNASREDLISFARLTGNNDVHKLSINDLCTTNSEISSHTKIEHVGGNNHE
jgi:glutamate synthase domain-containing protein 2